MYNYIKLYNHLLQIRPHAADSDVGLAPDLVTQAQVHVGKRTLGVNAQCIVQEVPRFVMMPDRHQFPRQVGQRPDLAVIVELAFERAAVQRALLQRAPFAHSPPLPGALLALAAPAERALQAL